VYYALAFEACRPMHCIVLGVLPVTPARIFEFLVWIGVIFLHDGWYLWLVLRHVFVVVVDLIIVAVACDP
jgi:hypothetical protein